MPNLLFIPFKQSYNAPVKQAVREYIHDHTDEHPDAFKWDISQWETLREEGRGGKTHVDRIQPTVRYHAHLVFILTKFPSDIDLEIAYAPVFSPKSIPITMRSLTFERASVIFNLGALYSQLASAEDRATEDGIKCAINYYQMAAGTFSYLLSSALPNLEFAADGEDIPLDLTVAFVKSLEFLMLAQAQECVWQKAIVGHLKNSLIAKLARKVSSLYRASATTICEASKEIRTIFPSNWIPHLEAKQSHFAAAAQYRKSMDEFEANKYGVEVGRLHLARVEAEKGYDIARRGGVVKAVQDDIKSLSENVTKDIARAERDNDLIYHQDVPTAANLEAIPEATVAQFIIAPGLKDPQSALENEGVIFSEMPSWGAVEAINIYRHNKNMLIQDWIIIPAQEMDDEAHNTLRSLNLPASLDALERPISLPPSLLRKANEVRQEDGPARIEESIDSVERYAEHDSKLLDEAMDILDNEASEDESARSSKPLERPPSHIANRELTSKGEQYRRILAEASDSDEHVRQKWDQWEIDIRELTWDEADLEVRVPTSTVSKVGPTSAGATEAKKQARALTLLLESLEDIKRIRRKLVDRATQLADADDIGPRIMKVATGFERWLDVQPEMFADVSDEELVKYDKFLQDMENTREKQESTLKDIKICNEAFLQSRKEDSSVRERERALQELDVAYHMYREIMRNLEEGLKFYNDLANILTQFKESCKLWSNSRSQELHSLAQSMNSMSMQDTESIPSQPKASSALAKRQLRGLPSLNSAEWETEDLPPPPPQTRTKKRA